MTAHACPGGTSTMRNPAPGCRHPPVLLPRGTTFQQPPSPGLRPESFTAGRPRSLGLGGDAAQRRVPLALCVSAASRVTPRPSPRALPRPHPRRLSADDASDRPPGFYRSKRPRPRRATRRGGGDPRVSGRAPPGSGTELDPLETRVALATHRQRRSRTAASGAALVRLRSDSASSTAGGAAKKLRSLRARHWAQN